MSWMEMKAAAEARRDEARAEMKAAQDRDDRRAQTKWRRKAKEEQERVAHCEGMARQQGE